jgi:hypothetical protein
MRKIRPARGGERAGAGKGKLCEPLVPREWIFRMALVEQQHSEAAKGVELWRSAVEPTKLRMAARPTGARSHNSVRSSRTAQRDKRRGRSNIQATTKPKIRTCARRSTVRQILTG